MSEADEHEQADTVDGNDVRRELSPLVALCGLLLAGAAALPLLPDGRSFAALVVEILADKPIDGLIVAVGLGSPFLFGVSLALAPVLLRTGDAGSSLLRVLVTSVLAVLHAQLLLAALWLVGNKAGIASGALLGFAGVSGLFFVFDSARHAAGDGAFGTARLMGLARWGATVIYGTAAWIRLQLLAGVRFGIAVDVALLAAVAIALLVRPRVQRAAARPT